MDCNFTDNLYAETDNDCGGCGNKVDDRIIIFVGKFIWHAQCLKCCTCGRGLIDQSSCFLREMKLYCKQDYIL